jgi:hypothetical protein
MFPSQLTYEQFECRRRRRDSPGRCAGISSQGFAGRGLSHELGRQENALRTIGRISEDAQRSISALKCVTNLKYRLLLQERGFYPALQQTSQQHYATEQRHYVL